MVLIHQSPKVILASEKNLMAKVSESQASRTPHANSTIPSNFLTESRSKSCKILRSVKNMIKQRRSDLKSIESQIQTNLDLAKDRITSNDLSSSYKANRIVAVLAMRRIKALDKSMDIIKTSIRELKDLKKLIEDDASQKDEVAERIRVIKSHAEQAKCEGTQAHSDDDLIHELNGRLMRQLLKGVSL